MHVYVDASINFDGEVGRAVLSAGGVNPSATEITTFLPSTHTSHYKPTLVPMTQSLL